MSNESGRYRINWVAEQTGIPETTLRAWERRYGVPEPARTPSGYRIYSPSDVEKVRRMRELCDGGMSPSEAAAAVAEQSESSPRPIDGGDQLRRTETVGPEQVGRTGELTLSSVIALMEESAVALVSGRSGRAARPCALGPVQLEAGAKMGDQVVCTSWITALDERRARVELRLTAGKDPQNQHALASGWVELALHK